ncbi:unnamed protein product, partial [Choristocarpus tenellus]
AANLLTLTGRSSVRVNSSYSLECGTKRRVVNKWHMEAQGRAPMAGSIYEPLFTAGTGGSVVAKPNHGREQQAHTPRYTKYPRFGKRGAPQAFPSKLYEILDEEDPAIVGWTTTGKGFEVRNHERFSREILGRYFKQDKFSSFQRQLNLYGFRKVTKGAELGSYMHPYFQRGDTDNLMNIRRATKPTPARPTPANQLQCPRNASVKTPPHSRVNILPAPPPQSAHWEEHTNTGETSHRHSGRETVSRAGEKGISGVGGERRGQRKVDLNERETEVVGLLQCMAQSATKDEPADGGEQGDKGEATPHPEYEQWSSSAPHIYPGGGLGVASYPRHGYPYPRGHDSGHLGQHQQGEWGPEKSATQDFAERLYDILTRESEAVISWTQSGTGFIVRDPEQLSSEILPRYFHRDELEDFWKLFEECGFRERFDGPEAGSYAHENFLRGRPNLLRYVGGRSVNGSESRSRNGLHEREKDRQMLPLSRASHVHLPYRMPNHALSPVGWPGSLTRGGYTGDVQSGMGAGQGMTRGLGLRQGPDPDGKVGEEQMPAHGSSSGYRSSTSGRHPGFNPNAVHLHGGGSGVLEARQGG